jgi:hypothetical protein
MAGETLPFCQARGTLHKFSYFFTLKNERLA